MPLVELLQNLQSFNYYYGGPGNFTQKSLQYGKDQPGGLSSGEPYVRFPLPENASNSILNYYVANRASLDFPIRGGSLQYLPTGLIIPRSATYDVQRISRFLKSSPKGYTFIAKQVGLQLTNPKIEAGHQPNLYSGNTSNRYFGVIENTRIYNNGINTLTQVGLQGSGVHADRHGLIPYNPQSTTYAKVVETYNIKNQGTGNRLVVLYTNKILNRKNLQVASNPTLYFNNLDNLIRLGIPRSNEDTLFEYPGGPQSVYGLGLTTIRRANNNNYLLYKNIPLGDGTLQNILNNPEIRNRPPSAPELSPGYLNFVKSNNEDNKDRLKTLYESLIQPNNVVSQTLSNRDFLAALQNNTGVPNLVTRSTGPSNTNTVVRQYILPGTPTENITLFRAINTTTDTNTLVANPTPATNGARTFNYGMIISAKPGKGEVKEDFRIKINSELGTEPKLPTGSYGSAALSRRGDIPFGSKDPINMLDIGKEAAKDSDLISFYFTALNYPDISGTRITFRAYLTDLQDNHSAEIQPFRYLGRGENFYTYNGANRQITFNLKTAAFSSDELEMIYRKTNYLISQVYPDYNVENGFMRSPIVKLTIGNYLVNQPGFLTSIGVVVDNEVPWDIDTGRQLPTVLTLACQFIPIQNYLPRRSTPDKKLTPFISTTEGWLTSPNS